MRDEEENVFYVIAGDMLQGSLIDTEFKGISTIEIMNYLSPDVVALGNHELDYGLPHLLFLEKMANFPIVNANLYIRKNQPAAHAALPHHPEGRLRHPVHRHPHREGHGLAVARRADRQLRRPRGGQQPRSAGSRTPTRTKDIDLTILLTHIGFESDVELARMLDPAWGVDMIIGGHSHTILEQPGRGERRAHRTGGVGTDQIGRFDIVVDDDTNSIVEWKWQLVPIEPGIAEPDERLVEFISPTSRSSTTSTARC